MAETREETSAASSALERLKASQPRTDGAGTPAAERAVHGAHRNPGPRPARPPAPSDAAPDAAPASPHPATDVPVPGRPPSIPPRPQTPPAARHMVSHHPDAGADTRGNAAGFRLGEWLDQLGEPDWEQIRTRGSEFVERQKRAAQARAHARGVRRRQRERERLAEAERRKELAAARAEQERLERERAEAEQAEAERLQREDLERQRLEGERSERERLAREAAELERTAGEAPSGPAPDGSDAVDAGSAGTGSALAAPDAAGDRATGAGTAPGVAGRPSAAAAAPQDLEAIVASAQQAIRASRTARPYPDDEPEPVYVAPYNLPSFGPEPEEAPADLYRRIAVSAAALGSLFLGFWALGLFGGATAHSGPDSPFRPRGSLLSMGTDSFTLWGVVLAGLVLFAGFQWLPGQRSARRQRALGYPAAAAALLGALWLVCARNGMVSSALWIAIVLTGVLLFTLRHVNLRTARTRAERFFTDAPLMLFLGWMLAVLPMNLAVWLTRAGIELLLPAEWWAVLTLVGATWAAVSFAMSERGRIVLALGFAWGLAWMMLPRLIGANTSALVALVAGVCAFVVLLATENRRYQIGHAERRAARGQRTEF
ncbi:hypothetical protein ACQ3I4_13735 [Zafaria sp. Z1313]|uniref:hypothetical protein n=1 Tax=unclassified Zafaria TaxID=2828765 RepID=UPI002E78E5C7|nr:hypothetical protein [Zafaria sp. J156]MEE1622680.1 hypothetical protein [Zafaria sp. J156]